MLRNRQTHNDKHRTHAESVRAVMLRDRQTDSDKHTTHTESVWAVTLRNRHTMTNIQHTLRVCGLLRYVTDTL